MISFGFVEQVKVFIGFVLSQILFWDFTQLVNFDGGTWAPLGYKVAFDTQTGWDRTERDMMGQDETTCLSHVWYD